MKKERDSFQGKTRINGLIKKYVGVKKKKTQERMSLLKLFFIMDKK